MSDNAAAKVLAGIDRAIGPDRTVIVMVKGDGEVADLFTVGPPQEVGQLLDAAMRHFGVVDAATKA